MKIRYREDYPHPEPYKISEQKEIKNGTVNDLMERLLLIAKPLDQITLKEIFESPNAYSRSGIYIYFHPTKPTTVYVGMTIATSGKYINYGLMGRPFAAVDGSFFYFYTTAEMWKLRLAMIVMEKQDKLKIEKLEALLIATTRPPINVQPNSDADYDKFKDYLDQKQ